jgi:fumarylacetoacetase
MTPALNRTHDADARSWLATANGDTDFPIQNLPLGVFRRAGSSEAFRGGVAIGDQVLDLGCLAQSGCLGAEALEPVTAASQRTLNQFLAMGSPAWRTLRHQLFDLLSSSAEASVASAIRECLVPIASSEFALPVNIGNYTDFYTSVHHARNVGKMVRPDSPVTPNFHWMPIAYHGRASSICISGSGVRRPIGQQMPAAGRQPTFGPCQRLDYELELGVYVGRGNVQGERISASQADDHIFGMSLLNDWSARDIQFWEAAPLGPFLAKNFATSVSPWIITMEALAPYRLPWTPDESRPPPFPYLDSARTRREGVLDIQLEVWLDSGRGPSGSEAPTRLSATSFRHQYWTVGQMVAHHTVGGCNLQPGDLLGTGTISGPAPDEAGALIELTEAGKLPIRLATGGTRGFLEDGDQVRLKGWCVRKGFARIGFGECTGTVLPAAMDSELQPASARE